MSFLQSVFILYTRGFQILLFHRALWKFCWIRWTPCCYIRYYRFLEKKKKGRSIHENLRCRWVSTMDLLNYVLHHRIPINFLESPLTTVAYVLPILCHAHLRPPSDLPWTLWVHLDHFGNYRFTRSFYLLPLLSIHHIHSFNCLKTLIVASLKTLKRCLLSPSLFVTTLLSIPVKFEPEKVSNRDRF